MKSIIVLLTIFFLNSGINNPGEPSNSFVSNIEESGFDNVFSDTLVIKLGVLPGQMKFDKPILEVGAGRNVSIVFKNNGIMPHNLLILEIGSKDIVGKVADQMISQKDAKEKHYIPDVEEVLFYTPVVDPGKEFKLNFTVPKEKGDYPILCTFPGHWRIMQGVLKVH